MLDLVSSLVKKASESLNIDFGCNKVTNLVLYYTLPRVSDKVRFRCLQFSGHCFRSPQLVSDFLFWKPSGKFRPGQGFLLTQDGAPLN